MNVRKFLLVLTLVNISFSCVLCEKESKNVTDLQSNRTATNNRTAISAPTGGNFLTNAFDAMRKFLFTRNQSANTKHENVSIISKRMNINDTKLFCPEEKEATFELFSRSCKVEQDCGTLGKAFLCCNLFGSLRCHEGFEKPLEDDIPHESIFGIQRKCPREPLAETFWDIKKCEIDSDCDFPRICCPNGRKRYCMTTELPQNLGKQLSYPVESISQFLQCTPPPPLAFDRYPKACNSSLQCFPHICCLENGKKHCRPPKRNILAALTTFSQRFNVGWIRQWTDNLVIR